MLDHRCFGAQVLQAGAGNSAAIFYLSPLSAGKPSWPARGGVPVLFPQFADRGPLPRHGLVRTARWTLLEERAAAEDHRVRYGLTIGPTDFSAWPHGADLGLTVEAHPDAVLFSMRVANTGLDAFSWTGGLHPYFEVEDLLACSISGLAGMGVQDKYDAGLKIQPTGPLTFDSRPFERLYDACTALTLNTPRHRLDLRANGFGQWMVWNPGADGAGSLADLPAAHWNRFVCVEPVCVDTPVLLAPGEAFDGCLRIELSEHRGC